MNDKLSAAIEELEVQLEQQLQQAAELKKMINALLRRMGEEPRFNDVLVDDVTFSASRRDAYYGKPLATAVTEYLKRRKQACTSEEIARGLEQGGFDFRTVGWAEENRARNISISLAKNSVTFHRLPNGTFGLLAWYPDVEKSPQKIVKKGKSHAAKAKPRAAKLPPGGAKPEAKEEKHEEST